MWYNKMCTAILASKLKKGSISMKNTTRIFFLVALGIAICTLAFADPQLEVGSTAYITADLLHLRDAPQGTIVGGAPYGSEVTILSGPDNNGYYKISYQGATYYVYGKYLDGTFIDVPRPVIVREKINYTHFLCGIDGSIERLLFVKRDTALALRKEPDKNSQIIDWLFNGTPLRIVNDNVPDGYGYFRVRTMDGLTGYAHSGSLVTEPVDGVTYSVLYADDSFAGGSYIGSKDAEYWANIICWY